MISSPPRILAGCLVLLSLAASAAAPVSQACRTEALELRRLRMLEDCTTSETVLIPDGYTLDGAGHTLTAVDPPAGHFRGAVVAAAGSEAHVRNLTITAHALRDVCDVGDERLSGILFSGASGSVQHVVVRDIHQGPVSGCTEGVAILLRHAPAASTPAQVVVADSVLLRYQRAGIVANGRLQVTLVRNLVDAGGPRAALAPNGIQLGLGATGVVADNRLQGHCYTGNQTVGAGILVFGGPLYQSPFSVEVLLEDNTLLENDIGLYLDQPGEDGGPPATPTRLRIRGNRIRNLAVSNGYVFQAGIFAVGREDTLERNTITGRGYDPSILPGSLFRIILYEAQGATALKPGAREAPRPSPLR
jgi:hypothetical protein